ncbi:hypothetical protein FIV00_23045 [Labrenzia sp. THAF82]|nr:hypothetical protein FIV00_23045 [Labrenzia sp. THAF82]
MVPAKRETGALDVGVFIQLRLLDIDGRERSFETFVVRVTNRADRAGQSEGPPLFWWIP